jgi:hypothetical protein
LRFERLDFPRHDAAGLSRGMDSLQATLRRGGIQPRREEFRSCETRERAAAIAALVAGVATALAGWRRAVWLVCMALICGVFAVAALAGAVDRFLPHVARSNLEAVIEPRGPVRSELVLAAHVDSKTEPLDHMQRTVLFTGVLVLAGVAGAFRHRRRAARAAACATALGCAACAWQWTGGAGLAPPSHGMADDAAAALILADLAVQKQAEPLETTRLRCVWFAAEEHGAQGSRAWARPQAGITLVNLECIGAGPELGIAMREWTDKQCRAPDSTLVRALERASPRPLHRFPWPIVSDAGACLARSNRAVTLLGLDSGGRPPRRLHSAADARAALDFAACRDAATALRALLTNWDAGAALSP